MKIQNLLIIGGFFYLGYFLFAPAPHQYKTLADLKPILRAEASIPYETSLPTARVYSREAEEINAGRNPKDVADEIFEMHKAEWNIQRHHERSATILTSPLGTTVTYTFTQDGVPISGLSIAIELGRNNVLRHIQNDYRAVEPADLRARMMEADEAVTTLDKQYESTPEGLDESARSMLIYAAPSTLKASAAYVLPMVEVGNGGQTRRDVNVLVRATDGQVLDVTYRRAENSPMAEAIQKADSQEQESEAEVLSLAPINDADEGTEETL